MLYLALSSLASAATLTVDPADSAAYATIGDAIGAASSGDRIEIVAGTYTECLDTAGKDLELVGLSGSGATEIDATGICRTRSFIVDGGETVSLQGLSLTHLYWGLFDVQSSTLTLDDVVVHDVTGGTNAALMASDSVITITSSEFRDNTATYFGALLLMDSDLTLSDSTISGNASGNYGGAMYFHASGPQDLVIEGCTFESNVAYNGWGGAIAVWGDDRTDADESSVTITDSTFSGNITSTSSDEGGALYISTVDELTLTGNTFSGNSARNSGGAVALLDSDVVTVEENLFCANETWNGLGAAAWSWRNSSETWQRNRFVENDGRISNGGAMAFSTVTSASVVNNTFVGNVTTGSSASGSALYATSSAVTFLDNIVAYGTGGGAIYLKDAATDTASSFTYNDFYANSASDTGGYATFSTSAGGNLTDDPMFVSYSADGDCTNDDLSLSSSSTLIDAGDPSLLDPDGSIADIGAYGGGMYVAVDADGDGSYSDSDCDDADPAAYPGATEFCNAKDDDCDGAIDESGATGESTWYADADGDGFGDAAVSTLACDAAEGWVGDATDCDDTAATTFPGAIETWYDGIDADCAGDDDDDQDGDGFAKGPDCDDTDPDVNPDAPEIYYDGIDQNCNPDDGNDQDGDGWDAFGDGDCDDTDPDVHPDAPDAWYDGVDSDCADNDDYDADYDGYPVDVDCDDLDEAVHPGASETWYDGTDGDCAGGDDFDQDGDGHTVDVDCDDTDADVFPGALDAWYDGIDSDCAGNDDHDQDGDAFAADLDCDDLDPTLNPGAADVADDGIDQDCDGLDARSPEPEPAPEPGCKGCDQGGGIAPWTALIAMGALLRRRR